MYLLTHPNFDYLILQFTLSRLEARPHSPVCRAVTQEPQVPGSIPGLAIYFGFSFKGSCQLITGESKSAQEKCG